MAIGCCRRACARVYRKKFAAEFTPYVVSKQETFNSFSRSTVKKINNKESWSFATDPLDEEWQQWYLHEFLMSEHTWININGKFLPCIITSEDDEITFDDKTKKTMHTVSFTAKLDFCGSTII